MESIAEQLREKLAASGVPSHVVAASLGVNPVSVRRFAGGNHGLSPENISKLAAFLGYEIRARLVKKSQKI